MNDNRKPMRQPDERDAKMRDRDVTTRSRMERGEITDRQNDEMLDETQWETNLGKEHTRSQTGAGE